ncbi:BQ5605_C025g10033 [Microbotryum silenes-dioicae]|uniref:BQ5605_C025g10033 protein n=1 Tax=Microbotryum silenes-dioicae TaxID=796604 RepID=A0A2X0MQI4_9BASI|nr:BQ5605_C025g10033 [Microbotryum silenes-dioicae]
MTSFSDTTTHTRTPACDRPKRVVSVNTVVCKLLISYNKGKLIRPKSRKTNDIKD